jgi:hypothetical protein
MVQIDGAPGASGASYVRTTAIVDHGHYSTALQLPHFRPDPAWPGRFDGLSLYASCPGSRIPLATSGVEITGVELAATGTEIPHLVWVSLLAILFGLACWIATVRSKAGDVRHLGL